MMLNSSSVAHSILAEEVDNCNSNNNNNNSLLNDLSFHNDDIIINGSLNHAVYDTTVFDVLKVDSEDFAVSIKYIQNITYRLNLLCIIDKRLIK